MRYKALDALRGLAALVVVFAHCYEAIPETIRNAKPYVNFAFFSFAEFSHFSVLLFFVLSGFVLSLPYLTGKHQSYGQYVTRRICRLYPPYVVAVLVSAFLCTLLADPGFWVGSWLQPVTGRMLAEHLLMTGVGENSIALDSPIWSLIVEFRVSLIFPLLVLGVRRFGWLAVASGALLAIACYELNVMRGAHGYTLSEIGQDAIGTLLVTGRYHAFFLFGIIAAARLDQFRSILLRMPRTLHVAICVGAVVVHVVLAQ